MADGERAGQRFHEALAGEIVAHIAEAARRVEAKFRVVADDAAGLLAAMLQRVKPEGHEIRGVREADDTEYAALLAQLVVVERVGGGHDAGQGQGQAPNPWMSLGASLTRLAGRCHETITKCSALPRVGDAGLTGDRVMSDANGSGAGQGAGVQGRAPPRGSAHYVDRPLQTTCQACVTATARHPRSGSGRVALADKLLVLRGDPAQRLFGLL